MNPKDPDRRQLAKSINELRKAVEAALNEIETKLGRLDQAPDAENVDDDSRATTLRLPIDGPTRHSGDSPRMHQMKIYVSSDERFKFDSLATAISEACGSRVSAANLLRAAITVLHGCESDLVDLVRSSGVRRPHNRDADGIYEFEAALASLIADAASNYRP